MLYWMEASFAHIPRYWNEETDDVMAKTGCIDLS